MNLLQDLVFMFEDKKKDKAIPVIIDVISVRGCRGSTKSQNTDKYRAMETSLYFKLQTSTGNEIAIKNYHAGRKPNTGCLQVTNK